MNQTRYSSPLLLFSRTLILSALVVFFSPALQAQSAPDTTNSAEALQSRIERARALIAAHQLEIAASELESVRAATKDQVLRNITSVMLMSIYLESGNYLRAEALLEENFRERSIQNHDSIRTYFALAGQAINGARTHLARYRSFGINTADSNLPPEAINDLDRLRSFLERMTAQAKDISNERKAYDSLSLLEDVLGIRLSLAKDSEDQAKWAAEYVAARELLAASKTQIASLGGMPALLPKVPFQGAPSQSPYSTRQSAERPPEMKTAEKAEVAAEPTGSLIARATKKVFPRYPALAKQNRASGLVRVHIIVDETGKVVGVSRSEGPQLLRQAAEEAARQWFFGTLSVEGTPARLSGYIDFNFLL